MSDFENSEIKSHLESRRVETLSSSHVHHQVFSATRISN
jgi:hypothetical protein